MIVLKIKSYLLLFTLFMVQQAYSQNIIPTVPLPVYAVPAASDTAKPMIMYISGDGGWNKFSKSLCANLASRGYPVAALDAKEYFWKKKAAAQLALDITRLIGTYERTFNRKKIVLMGYSFGADVLPFVYNLLPANLKAQVLNLSMVSPTGYTDFEIHISGMLGINFMGGEHVANEINKITLKPITLIFGMDENEFPLNQLKIKNYKAIRLQGGHHYTGDEVKLYNTIAKNIE